MLCKSSLSASICNFFYVLRRFDYGRLKKILARERGLPYMQREIQFSLGDKVHDLKVCGIAHAKEGLHINFA